MDILIRRRHFDRPRLHDDELQNDDQIAFIRTLYRMLKDVVKYQWPPVIHSLTCRQASITAQYSVKHVQIQMQMQKQMASARPLITYRVSLSPNPDYSGTKAKRSLQSRNGSVTRHLSAFNFRGKQAKTSTQVPAQAHVSLHAQKSGTWWSASQADRVSQSG